MAISTLTSGALPCGALIAYAAQGTLHAARDNVVLVSTWYTGTSKIMQQIYVGTGPVLDPAKDSIILANQWGLACQPCRPILRRREVPHSPACRCAMV